MLHPFWLVDSFEGPRLFVLGYYRWPLATTDLVGHNREFAV